MIVLLAKGSMLHNCFAAGAHACRVISWQGGSLPEFHCLGVWPCFATVVLSPWAQARNCTRLLPKNLGGFSVKSFSLDCKLNSSPRPELFSSRPSVLPFSERMLGQCCGAYQSPSAHRPLWLNREPRLLRRFPSCLHQPLQLGSAATKWIMVCSSADRSMNGHSPSFVMLHLWINSSCALRSLSTSRRQR